MTLSALWIWGRRRVIEFVSEREIKVAFDAGRKVISEALDNQALTADQRAEFEKKRVELDQRIVEYRMSRVSRRLGPP